MSRLLLALATLSTAVLLSGCALALGPYHLIDGREFPQEVAVSFAPGMVPSEVEAMLGEPWERQEDKNKLTWLYYSRYRLRWCQAYLFGFIPIRSIPKESFNLRLVFGSSGLEHAMLREHRPDGSERILPLLAARAGESTSEPLR